MSRVYKRLIVINIFGGLFYIFCILQWLWAILPYLPEFISLATKLQPTTPQPAPVVAQAASAGPPSVFMVLLASIITVGVLAATAYVLIKLPTTIGKTGEKLTKGASQYLVPAISHHAKLTPKKRRQLTARVVLIVKVALCIVPVIVVALSFNVTGAISYAAALIVAAFLAAVALFLLSAQLLFAKLLKVPLKDTW